MQLLLVLALCAATAYAQTYTNLRFKHKVLGELMVTTNAKKFPLLTPVKNPDIVYVTPTADQLNMINGKAGRQRRQSTSLNPDLKTLVSNFLAKEFGSDITASNLPSMDLSDLPFKNFAMISEYDQFQIPKETYMQFASAYLIQLNDVALTTPWYPAKKIYNQLNVCQYVYYGATGSQDIRFESTNGGTMAYYKVTCSYDFPSDTVVLGIEIYCTQFQLQPIAKVTSVTQEWNTLFGAAKQTMNGVMYENRALTAGQIQLLIGFLRGIIVREVRNDYSPYLFPVMKTQS